MKAKTAVSLGVSLLALLATSVAGRAQLLWQVGKFDGAWETAAGTGGGPSAAFVAETGAINDLPGAPDSPVVDRQSDNDYYFAGSYTTTIPSVVAAYMDYMPVGTVAVNEEGAERAFAAADNDWRVHFNLPTTLKTNDMVYVTWANNNLDTTNPDPFYGVSIWINGKQLTSEITITNAALNKQFTSPLVSLASVDAQFGPGFDNIVSLKGYNHNADGGGNWMGIDAASLTAVVANPTNAGPVLPLAWTCGVKDNAWPTGTGGGAKASFVQENGSINPLPGSPTSTSVAKGADNDYYFAGSYTTTIPSVVEGYGDYTPVGTVAANEEAAERAFAGDDNDLRYHFNLPATLKLNDLLSVSFAAMNLDDPSDVNTDVRYGVEVYINNVLVQPEILIRPVDLQRDFTTPKIRLDAVNAQVGPGYDNVVSLKGHNYSTDGGGAWMGIDYVALNAGSSGVTDNDPPTVFSVTRYGSDAKLQVTFSEKVNSATANVAANYVLGSGVAVNGATLQPDGTNVVLITGLMPVGTADTVTVTGVKDLAGNSIVGKAVSFTTKYEVLLVTADPGPLTFAGDQAVLKRLQDRGFDVALSTGTAVPDDGSTGNGKDLIIVSSSLASSSVVAAAGGAKFKYTPVPVIEWESALEDDFTFQDANGTTYTNQTQINIVDAKSPLAAGYPAGLLTVTTSPQTFSVGTPVGAHIVANSAPDPTQSPQALLYYYEKGDKGAATNSYTMPARRVFFFLQDNTAAALNAAGTKLFDAAVDFALGSGSGPSTEPPTLPMLWTCGIKDNAQPTTGSGGGPEANFVQESGGSNDLPGSADSTPVSGGADDDYYFAGDYSITIPSVVAMYGDYTPLGTVAADEDSAERAFVPSDNTKRYHSNLPTTLKSTDALSVTFSPQSLETGKADSRYGVAVYYNGILVMPEIVVRPGQLGTDYTTRPFTLASVNAQTGPGYDNIVTLKGYAYNADGGGSWMGFDYIQLNGGTPPVVIEPPKFLAPTVSGNKITLSWTGAGSLEWAPTVVGQWTAIAPAPTSPYSENIAAGQNRFYRLKQQ